MARNASTTAPVTARRRTSRGAQVIVGDGLIVRLTLSACRGGAALPQERMEPRPVLRASATRGVPSRSAKVWVADPRLMDVQASQADIPTDSAAWRASRPTRRGPPAASVARRLSTPSSTSACRRCARATCRPSALGAMEAFYPLHAKVCESCLLVQLEEFVTADAIFTEYAYFSSYSDSWVAHARDYVEMAVERFGLGPDSLVIELASNDGYLLQHVVERGIPALGIEPAANVARVARERGIETVVEFFGRDLAGRLAAEGRAADLLAANNVMAHVPDLNDFVGGIETCWRPRAWRRSRFLTSCASSRATSSTRSTTSTSRTSRCSPRAGCSRRTASSCSTSTSCKSHGGSLRLYAQRADDRSPGGDITRCRSGGARACPRFRHARGASLVLSTR